MILKKLSSSDITLPDRAAWCFPEQRVLTWFRDLRPRGGNQKKVAGEKLVSKNLRVFYCQAQLPCPGDVEQLVRRS